MAEELTAAQVLRRAREARGISLRAAASDMGLAASQLSRMERGLRGVSTESAGQLRQYYGLSDDEMALAEGRVPADVMRILLENPDLIELIRKKGRGV
ncbi:helix-turn-helix transcriptional regulator [Aeromicrobium sp. IC_218]|uniref:helix-turn-helix domain-containing protein n=1 Tax=Aeromicrobium sp. IC_218 TaxID=2545468 RepID=UPI0013F3F6ED|nr:helix-turn-helix transcriptional regulator [Aeromicrobium sp. IC_218]